MNLNHFMKSEHVGQNSPNVQDYVFVANLYNTMNVAIEAKIKKPQKVVFLQNQFDVALFGHKMI